MAAKEYNLSGMCKWAMLTAVDPKFGHHKIVLYPDDKSWKLFKESGSRLGPKKDEDGEYITIRRDPNHPIRDFGGPPKVVDADGKPTDVLIGNGSKVTCKISVYDSKFGKGTRLEAVRIDSLIPYEKKQKDGDDDAKPSDKKKSDGMPF